MVKHWIEYKCNSGQTLFVYNKETGEHKWPHGLGKGIEYRIMYGHPVEYKEYRTLSIQTDDNGCSNECTSMYIKTDPSHVLDTSNTCTTLLQQPIVSDEEHSLNCEGDLTKTAKLERKDEQDEGQSSRMETANQSNSVENINSKNDNDFSKNAFKRDSDDEHLDQRIYNISEMLLNRKGMTSEQSKLESDNFCEEKDETVLADDENNDGFASMVYCGNNYDNENSYSSMVGCGDTNIDNADNKDKNDDVDDLAGNDDNVESGPTIFGGQYDKYDESGRLNVYPYMTTPSVDTAPEVVLHPNAFAVERMQVTPGSGSNEVSTLNGMRQDTQNHQYECPIPLCKRTFKEKCNLVKHMRNGRMHASTKSYECNFCHKRFSRKDTLTLHIRLHTGEKLTECSYCKKKFSKKWDFIRHVETHKREKPSPKREVRKREVRKAFQCFVCKDNFLLEEYLIEHFKGHMAMGYKPLECPVCKMQFIQKTDFDKHFETHAKPYEYSAQNQLGEKIIQNSYTYFNNFVGDPP